MPELNDGRRMSIKLNFNDLKSISANSELDLLEVVVKETLYSRLTSNLTVWFYEGQ
jgi:hypothetical protein